MENSELTSLFMGEPRFWVTGSVLENASDTFVLRPSFNVNSRTTNNNLIQTHHWRTGYVR